MIFWDKFNIIIQIYKEHFEKTKSDHVKMFDVLEKNEKAAEHEVSFILINYK